MKKQVLILAILIITFTLNSETIKKFGEEITVKDLTKISTLLEKPENFLKEKVKIKGTIVDVCKNKGCWMELSSDKEFQKIRVKVKDGDMVFPLTLKGKTAEAEGILYKISLSKEQVIKWKTHQAEEHGTKFDPTSVTEGMIFFQFKPSGVVVKTK